MSDSLWGNDFDIVEPSVEKITNKIKSPKKVEKSVEKILSSSKSTVEDKIKLIREEVTRILGKFADRVEVIYTEEELSKYIDDAISFGYIAIDTETNKSLDPLTCKLMGPCIYTVGRKAAYVPVNHIDHLTGVRLQNQCTEEQVKRQFDRLKDNALVIMHNGQFDYRVIKCTCNCVLDIYWDTLIGARVINENEKAALKTQYITHIDSSIEKYSIESLFKDIPYEVLPPELFALYAATDALLTFELFEWQKSKLELPENTDIYNLFMNVEMPVVKIVAEMELYGIDLDLEYAKRLSAKYNKMLDKVNDEIYLELNNLTDKINAWRETKDANTIPLDTEFKNPKTKSQQLETPVNIGSHTQLAILLYDVLKSPVVDMKSPRGTGEDILKKMDFPICKLILEYRGINKLLSTYIDKIPQCINPTTGRLHAGFDQYGAGTGRFSSSEPNLQNIPSKDKSIRMMFKASDGCVLVGSDFSLQKVG